MTLSAGDGDGADAMSSGTGIVDDEPLGEFDSDSRADRQARVIHDASALIGLLNAFWTAELQRLYGLRFDEPDEVLYYFRDTTEACTGSRLNPTNNAYYCFTDGDEHIAFDMHWFQGYLVEHPGDATTFLILAHEWGHAVQDTWMEQQPGVDTWTPAYRKELNADCLAGSFLAAALRSGDVLEEVGDADAIFDWLAEGGSVPWTDPGDHGTSVQRTQAFSDGFQQGTDHCRVNY